MERQGGAGKDREEQVDIEKCLKFKTFRLLVPKQEKRLDSLNLESKKPLKNSIKSQNKATYTPVHENALQPSQKNIKILPKTQ